MRREILLALLLGAVCIGLVLLAGCATWTHPYKDAAAFEMDLHQCEVQAAPAEPMRAMVMKDRCMRVQGWRQ